METLILWPDMFSHDDSFAFHVTAIDLEDKLNLNDAWKGLYWFTEGGQPYSFGDELLDRVLGGGKRPSGDEILSFLGRERSWSLVREGDDFLLSYTDGGNDLPFRLTPILPRVKEALRNQRKLCGLQVCLEPSDCEDVAAFCGLREKVTGLLENGGFAGIAESLKGLLKSATSLGEALKIVGEYVEIELGNES